ncbi:MAG: arylesterase [Gammaproteobacteria bacterium]
MRTLSVISIKRTATALLFALSVSLTACDDPPRTSRLPADATILAFGNSLTYGTGAPRDKSYPAVLQELTGRTVINAGVPGEVSAEGLRRLPALLEEHQPALVVLIHGGNDFLRRNDHGHTAANLEAMIEAACKQGATVVLAGVPKPGIFLGSADFYKEVANRHKLPIDEEILPEILGDRKFKSDPIHPNAKGYRKLAEAVYNLLRNAGAI